MNATMHWYRVEPRDPLMVRDGRPFSVDTDGARSLDFPPPSVLAGMVRTRVGLHAGGGTFKMSPDAARQIGIVGPLLARLGADDAPTPLVPSPRDLVLMPPVEGAPPRRYRLHPAAEPLAMGSLPRRLRPVVPVHALPKGKASSMPPFWTLGSLQAWLNAPPPAPDAPGDSDAAPALLHERRIHVGIDALTGTASDGKLFQTDGLRFHRRLDAGHIERLALIVGVQADYAVPDGLAPLGGERRLAAVARLARGPLGAWDAPALPQARARVVLLTPAIFREGAVPEQIGGAPVVAAAVGRPHPISGWDMQARGPKPTRRMAPAGSVYWVDLAGHDPAAWVRRVHLCGVCSDEQDNRDGFGLAAVGVWP